MPHCPSSFPFRQALDMINDPDLNTYPNLIERIAEGGYQKYKENFKRESMKGLAWLDEKLHDRLLPVVDWIKDFNVQGLSEYEKQQIIDTLYAAEGIKQDIIVQAEINFKSYS